MFIAIISFVVGTAIGMFIMLVILSWYAKSIQAFSAKLIQIMRQDNAQYMATSLEAFKGQIADEIILAQQMIDEEAEEAEEEFFSTKSDNENNGGGFLN